ncbi:MAPEG family protein [Yoonia sp. I 8.24]|uniref:MAPEG family protein n=1 Tax=Yoonia sp. I 8.24 TaxID=1537229 RepID=UPI001EDD4F9F|nr:MAPEG family protein [Yoonia sp. I 8.24]MCG3268615.1 MAPEG family protein [Yoonia sp. I 8.24]
MILPITATIAVLLGVLVFPLTVYVSLQRARVGKEAGKLTAAAFGPHPDVKLTATIRAHGNLMEYAAFGLVMIGLAEANGAQAAWLMPVGLAFVAGRWLHTFAMLTNPYPPALRGIGMVTTYAAIVGPVIYLGLQLI